MKEISFSEAPGARGVPAGERADVFSENEAVVFVAQQIFEQDFQREGKAGDVADAGAFERVEAVDFKGIVADAELAARAEGVLGMGAHARVAAPLI